MCYTHQHESIHYCGVRIIKFLILNSSSKFEFYPDSILKKSRIVKLFPFRNLHILSRIENGYFQLIFIKYLESKCKLLALNTRYYGQVGVDNF